jgi:hypothetical protein
MQVVMLRERRMRVEQHDTEHQGGSEHRDRSAPPPGASTSG